MQLRPMRQWPQNRKAVYKEKKLTKEIPPYAKHLSFEQLNTLLKKYPQHTK